MVITLPSAAEKMCIRDRYCMEYAKPVAAGSEIRIGVYHPQDGKWKGIVKNGTTLAAYPQIGERLSLIHILRRFFWHRAMEWVQRH